MTRVLAAPAIIGTITFPFQKIEVVMRYIFIVLFLVTFGSVSMGDVGDVYFCETTNLTLVRQHENVRSSNKKFKFKWNQLELKFGDQGYIKDSTLKIVWSGYEMFHAIDDSNYIVAMFDSGDFSYTQGGFGAIISVMANCDKF